MDPFKGTSKNLPLSFSLRRGIKDEAKEKKVFRSSSLNKPFIIIILSLGLMPGFCFNAHAQENPARQKAEEYYDRARKAIYENDFKKAELNLYEAIDAYPQYADPYHLLGQMYENLHRDSMAMLIYTKLLEQDPDDFDGLMGRADVELILQKYDSAEVDYRKAAAVTGIPLKYHNIAQSKFQKMSYI